MSQCIDIIPPVLENSDILDISFYIATAVGQFLTQISLDTHIENIPVQPDPVTDTFLVEPLHISKLTSCKRRRIFFHYNSCNFSKEYASYRFFAQYPFMSQYNENIFPALIIRPVSRFAPTF